MHGWIFFTTEYTEAGESILKDTEMGSVISVWERSDLSVCSVVKWGLEISRVEHKEHKDFFLGGHSHFMKSECGVCFIGVGDGSSHFS